MNETVGQIGRGAGGGGGRIGIRRARSAAWAAAFALIVGAPAPGQLLMKEPPPETRGADISEKLGAAVPMDAELTNSKGEKVTLGSYFKGDKPVVLVLAYYRCPMICPITLSHLAEAVNGLDYDLGLNYQVVVVSFDPTETPKTAAEMERQYLGGYPRPVTPLVRSGWAFHTAEAGEARRIADAVGFGYRYIPESGEYAHPVALMALSPAGKVSRYIYGFSYTSRDLKLSLLDATAGKIAQSLGDIFLHICYRYDPNRGVYAVAAMTVMQIGGAMSALGVGTLLLALKAGERVRRRRRLEAQSGDGTPGAGAEEVGVTNQSLAAAGIGGRA